MSNAQFPRPAKLGMNFPRLHHPTDMSPPFWFIECLVYTRVSVSNMLRALPLHSCPANLPLLGSSEWTRLALRKSRPNSDGNSLDIFCGTAPNTFSRHFSETCWAPTQGSLHLWFKIRDPWVISHWRAYFHLQLESSKDSLLQHFTQSVIATVDNRAWLSSNPYVRWLAETNNWLSIVTGSQMQASNGLCYGCVLWAHSQCSFRDFECKLTLKPWASSGVVKQNSYRVCMLDVGNITNWK